MSEVKRWKLKGFLPGVEGECKAVFQPTVVMSEDFDRVTAERDALQAQLNESDELCGSLERSMKNHRHELGLVQQRLTAADERADVLEGLVGEVMDAVGREPLNFDAVMRLRARMRAALKPADGGGDEAI
ncbi:hypothetical protein ACI77F_07580 [Pseudomonas tritici]|uniref:hypothetical protein n=1 Tax=Pseudomonas tritici TaxID=2745518 RepID=UPI00387A98C0